MVELKNNTRLTGWAWNFQSFSCDTILTILHTTASSNKVYIKTTATTTIEKRNLDHTFSFVILLGGRTQFFFLLPKLINPTIPLPFPQKQKTLKSWKRQCHPMAYFWVQLRAVVSYLARSVLYMWAISGTRGSSGLGSVSNEQIESNTWFVCKYNLVFTLWTKENCQM